MPRVLFLGTKLRLQRTDLELEVYSGLFNLFFFVVLVKYGKCQVNFPACKSKPVHSGNVETTRDWYQIRMQEVSMEVSALQEHNYQSTLRSVKKYLSNSNNCNADYL